MAKMRTTVILKTDIVDSTPRTAQLTQTEMGMQRRQHKRLVAEVVHKSDGVIFQEEGDAYWIEFPSVTTAVLSAIDLHQSLRAIQLGKGKQERLAIRAIVTVGDILHQGIDTIGTTMSLTARIEKITPPDEVYLSYAAWLVLNKAEVETELVGQFTLKGFSESEKVYRVIQKHRTRVLRDQYIVYTDAGRFQSFIKSQDINVVEEFLISCDNLINQICDEHGGIIRKVDGDEYFLTFTKVEQTIEAVQALCDAWKGMVKQYGLGMSVGVHKGDLNVIRSFVFGDDIQMTVALTALGKVYRPGSDGIRVITSRKVRDELHKSEWTSRFRELPPDLFIDQTDPVLSFEHGAYELVVESD